MIKLVDLIKEQQIIAEVETLLGRSLTEAELEEIDLKRAARNLAAGVGLTAATMFGNTAQATTTPPMDSARTAITQTVNTVPKWEAKSYISVQKMNDWNKFVDWLKKTKVEDLKDDIETERKGSGVLAGNEIMNHEDYSDVVLEVYKDKHPETSLTKADVKPIQAQIGDYRIKTINQHKTDPKSVNFVFPVNPDYSNFMRPSSKSGEDGIVGKFTSQINFPKAYMTYFVNNKKTNTVDLGYATNLKEHKMTKNQLREVIRHLIRKELNEVNRFSPRLAFEKDIQSDPDYIDLKKKAASNPIPDEVPHASKKDYYIDDRFKDIENSNLEDDEDLMENHWEPEVEDPEIDTDTETEENDDYTFNPEEPGSLPKPGIKASAKEQDAIADLVRMYKAEKAKLNELNKKRKK